MRLGNGGVQLLEPTLPGFDAEEEGDEDPHKRKLNHFPLMGVPLRGMKMMPGRLILNFRA